MYQVFLDVLGYGKIHIHVYENSHTLFSFFHLLEQKNKKNQVFERICAR